MAKYTTHKVKNCSLQMFKYLSIELMGTLFSRKKKLVQHAKCTKVALVTYTTLYFKRTR